MNLSAWLATYEDLERRWQSEGRAALSEQELLWLLLRRQIDEIEHQGLLGFYCGDLAAELEYLLAGWQRLGMEELVNLFERVNRLLPAQGLADEAAQEALVELWQDSEYQKLLLELEGEFFELLPLAEEALDEVVKEVLAAHAE